MKLNIIKPILGSFSKAIDGSVALNFSQSGGKNCDLSCIYHPENHSMPEKNRCYAARAEIRPDRKALKDKLKRHEIDGAAETATKALEELKQICKTQKIPWLRISAFGSVPQPRHASKKFIKTTKKLFAFAKNNGILVHFPVETERKAQFYRKHTKNLVVVRQSVQSHDEWIGCLGPSSIVAGNSQLSQMERIAESKRLANIRIQATGRKTIVCPAVASSYINTERNRIKTGKYRKIQGDPKAKCGNCTACANPKVDIVYPSH